MKVPISRQFLQFFIAGLAGFIVDVAVLYLLAPVLGWYGARLLSFLTAATATWRLNRRYTFRSTSAGNTENWWAEYAKYLFSMIAGGLVNYATYSFVLYRFDVPGAPLLGVTAGSSLGLVFNFFAARSWVFRRKHP